MTIDNRQQLLGTINSQIKLNGTGAITGPILNNVLDTMVNSALFYAGNWSAYTNYFPLDVVEYNGNSYIANVTNVNVIPSSSSTIWGHLVLAAGVAGSVQYNDGSNGFAGSSNFTFDGTDLNAAVTAAHSTTSRTLANRFADMVNVKDFGAVGDGVTVDTLAIQAAINYAQTIKAWIYFPPVAVGYLTGPLTIGQSGTDYTCHFQGGGYDPSGASQAETGQYGGQSLLKLIAGNNQNLLTVNASAAQPMFRNMTFQGNYTQQTGTSYCVYLTDTTAQSYYTYACWMEDCYILGGLSGGLYIGTYRGSGLYRNLWVSYCGGTTAIDLHSYDQIFDSVQVGPNANAVGLSINGATQIQLINCVFFENNLGLQISNDCGMIQVTNCVFDANNTHGTAVAGGLASYAYGARTFANCAWQRNSRAATNTYSDIYVDSDQRLSLIGPNFVGPMGGSFVAKYNIQTASTSQSCVIRLVGQVAEANSGNVYGTAFTNDWSVFIESGDTSAHIGQPGGAGTISAIVGSTEMLRAYSAGLWLPNGTLGVNTTTGYGKVSVNPGPTLTAYDALTPNSYATAIYNSRSLTAAGAGWYHFLGQSGNGSTITTNNIIIYGNGNVQNANNSYGAISDASLKENIVDATPKLADLLKIQVRNFNLKDDETKLKQLGVVAQELETVFPNMVDTDKDGFKGVKYSVFVPMLIKAVQELSAKSDALEAKLAALKT